MSTQSTVYITREKAIERIKLINSLIKKKDFFELEKNSLEEGDILDLCLEVGKLVSRYNGIEIEHLTNKMLADILGKPFFRESLFYNYIIND